MAVGHGENLNVSPEIEKSSSYAGQVPLLLMGDKSNEEQEGWSTFQLLGRLVYLGCIPKGQIPNANLLSSSIFFEDARL